MVRLPSSVADGPRRHPSQVDVGAQTRERLLDAAERLFGQRGYDGTTLRDVTMAAACNVAAVNYHFGGKRSLYIEMFRRRLATIRAQRVSSIREAMERAHGPRALETVLAAFANAFLEPLVTQPEGRMLIELMARETVDAQLPPEMFAREFVEPVHRVLVEAITTTTPSVSPAHAQLCVLSIVGQLVHVAHVTRRAVNGGVARFAVPSLAQAVDHIVRFSAAGVRSCREATTGAAGGGLHRYSRRVTGGVESPPMGPAVETERQKA
jgi:TetR/AcrR family transcriptional regulator, regulator of cefoperazone and chloramphenicol sensitivity